MRDSESKQRAREWLEELLMSQSRWKEILDVYSQDPTPVEPTKDLRPFALAYQNAPMEQYQFAEGSKPFPIAINAAGMPVAEVEINGKPRRLVIDTGAAITTVSTDVARENGVVVAQHQGMAGTVTTRTIAIRGAVIDHLRLGGLVITNHPAAVVESSVLRVRLLGLTIFKIDGVLGWNAIRRMTLRINYRDKTTMISTPVKQPVTAPRNLFGIGEPIVELTDVHGERLLFGLDTGSAFSHLHEDALSRLDRVEARRKTMVIHGAGGPERYKSAVVPRLTLRVSGYALEFKNVRTVPSRNDATVRRDGRLGSDIGRHGSITIDALNGRFELLHEADSARSR